MVDLAKYPKQKGIIGKKVGETFKLAGVSLTYKITKIIANDTLIPQRCGKFSCKTRICCTSR